MEKADCRLGDRVIFGRGSGEKTLGKIVKLNAKSAKVEQLEERGSTRNRPVGTVWGVQYSLLEPAPEVRQAGYASTDIDFLGYLDPIERGIMKLICSCYTALSPENLREIPLTRKRVEKIKGQLIHLQSALGREVSEGLAMQWEN